MISEAMCRLNKIPFQNTNDWLNTITKNISKVEKAVWKHPESKAALNKKYWSEHITTLGLENATKL